MANGYDEGEQATEKSKLVSQPNKVFGEDEPDSDEAAIHNNLAIILAGMHLIWLLKNSCS